MTVEIRVSVVAICEFCISSSLLLREGQLGGRQSQLLNKEYCDDERGFPKCIKQNRTL